MDAANAGNPLASDALDLARRLIACRSVTPADDGAMDVIAEALATQGFTVERFAAGAAPDGPIENLFASRGQGSPHFAFAGHSDVVPAGAGWATDPFAGTIRGELLYGRGAVDMKGAIAAFAAAAARVPDHDGTLSLIVTGDEEGPATFGTVALIEWMRARGIRPDFCLVGEPTSDARLGDTIKIGRRGSVNIWIEVPGTQGHVAYPHLADNPATRLVAILGELGRWHLDDGNAWFQPSNLEVTDLDVGNPATRSESGPGSVRNASPDIFAVTGLDAELSTSGGTSDARFLSRLCPVVEFGLVNATMHKLDEAVALADLAALTDIYEGLIRRILAPAQPASATRSG